jgi:hypothetical protein
MRRLPFFLVLGILLHSCASKQTEPAPSVIEQPKGVSSAYRQYVLAPLSDGSTDFVRLESADMILAFDSNMAYTMTDKRTNTAKSGKMGFAGGMTKKNLNTVESSKVYLWETDAAGTQAPGIDFEKSAQTVLIPVSCTAENVTYKYERPQALFNQAVSFTITRVARAEGK